MSEYEGKHGPEHHHGEFTTAPSGKHTIPERNKEHLELPKVYEGRFDGQPLAQKPPHKNAEPAVGPVEAVNPVHIETKEPYIAGPKDKYPIHDPYNPQPATSVHARFRLAEDTRVTGFSRQKKDGTGWEYINGNRVKLYPVQGGPFGDATPSGEITMTIVNPDACKVFSEAEIGQEYDVIFTPVKKAE